MGQISFPIGLWNAPPLKLARYQEMAAGGFTVVPVGIQALIADPRIHRNLPNESVWQKRTGGSA